MSFNSRFYVGGGYPGGYVQPRGGHYSTVTAISDHMSASRGGYSAGYNYPGFGNYSYFGFGIPGIYRYGGNSGSYEPGWYGPEGIEYYYCDDSDCDPNDPNYYVDKDGNRYDPEHSENAGHAGHTEHGGPGSSAKGAEAGTGAAAGSGAGATAAGSGADAAEGSDSAAPADSSKPADKAAPAANANAAAGADAADGAAPVADAAADAAGEAKPVTADAADKADPSVDAAADESKWEDSEEVKAFTGLIDGNRNGLARVTTKSAEKLIILRPQSRYRGRSGQRRFAPILASFMRENRGEMERLLKALPDGSRLSIADPVNGALGTQAKDASLDEIHRFLEGWSPKNTAAKKLGMDVAPGVRYFVEARAGNGKNIKTPIIEVTNDGKKVVLTYDPSLNRRIDRRSVVILLREARRYLSGTDAVLFIYDTEIDLKKIRRKTIDIFIEKVKEKLDAVTSVDSATEADAGGGREARSRRGRRVAAKARPAKAARKVGRAVVARRERNLKTQFAHLLEPEEARTILNSIGKTGDAKYNRQLADIVGRAMTKYGEALKEYANGTEIKLLEEDLGWISEQKMPLERAKNIIDIWANGYKAVATFNNPKFKSNLDKVLENKPATILGRLEGLQKNIDKAVDCSPKWRHAYFNRQLAGLAGLIGGLKTRLPKDGTAGTE